MVAGLDLRRHRRSRGNAHQRTAEVAGGEHLCGAEASELTRDHLGVTAGVEGLDLAAELTRLGQQLERERDGLAPVGLGEHPRLAHRHESTSQGSRRTPTRPKAAAPAAARRRDERGGRAGSAGRPEHDWLARTERSE